MRCVAKIPGVDTIYELEETPADREGLEIEEGAWVEVPSDRSDRPAGIDRLLQRTLGRSTTDPKHYKLFEHPGEVEPAGFEPTGMIYSGRYSPSAWERFARAIPSIKAFHAMPDDDPPGAVDQALRYLREAR